MIHLHPDKAVEQKKLTLEKIRKAKGEDVYWQAVRQLCLTDYWYFVREILGWGWFDEVLHGKELLSFMEDNEEYDHGVAFPRGHLKTLSFCARNIQRILRNPNIAILAASATEALAKGIGSLIGNELLTNEKLHKAFPDLPTSTTETEMWGNRGYQLPKRSPRIDPTLYCTSIEANVTGRHPDIIWLDDLIVAHNNNPDGWAKAEEFIKNCLLLLPPHGHLELTFTRWHDADTYGRLISGKLTGKQGPIKFLIKSCWEDDNPLKQPIYPAAIRWDMPTISGFSPQMLEDMRANLGGFFNAQMRNDPKPESDQQIKVSDVNIFEKPDAPPHTRCHALGIESLGGGKLIIQALREEAEKLKLFLPIVEFTNSKGSKSVGKEDRILTALEPIVREGRLWAQRWMIPESQAEQESLGYEIRRLGAAKHDDIVDALHNVPVNLSKGLVPAEKEPAHLYISCDLAWTEKKTSDFCVLIAVAVDHRNNFWILDYDRFQNKSPIGIAMRVIQFFQKHDLAGSDSIERRVKRRGFGSTYK